MKLSLLWSSTAESLRSSFAGRVQREPTLLAACARVAEIACVSSSSSLPVGHEDPATEDASQAFFPTAKQEERTSHVSETVSVPAHDETHRHRRRVRFDETRNRSYANPYDDDDDDDEAATKVDRRDAWYSAQELARMKAQSRQEILALRRADRMDNTAGVPGNDLPTSTVTDASWTRSLRLVYQQCCVEDQRRYGRSDNDDDDMTVALPVVVTCAATDVGSMQRLGWEKRAVALVHADTTMRRRRLYDIVRQLQRVPIADGALRARMIRESSCALSRPARKFAVHVARMAVRHEA